MSHSTAQPPEQETHWQEQIESGGEREGEKTMSKQERKETMSNHFTFTSSCFELSFQGLLKRKRFFGGKDK